ncbi:MAG: dATP/dGTP diphosphohydrolase domain-containing protein, partial [Desulfatirhabdiaceae bacterium]
LNRGLRPPLFWVVEMNEAGENMPLSVNEQTLMEQLDSVGDTVCTMSDEKLRVLQREQEIINRKNRKWDEGKLKYRLILPGFLELMAEILTRGEVNHPCEPDGTPSWQLVEPEAYEDALFRHFQAYRKGEVIDTDPNMPTDHMGNIAVDAMFLWWFNRQREKVNG